MREQAKFLALGIGIGLVLMGSVWVGFARNRAGADIEFEAKLEAGQRVITELRGENQILTINQQRTTQALIEAEERAIRTEDRNRELTELVERTGIELATAVGEANSLTELLGRIITVVDNLFPDN